MLKWLKQHEVRKAFLLLDKSDSARSQVEHAMNEDKLRWACEQGLAGIVSTLCT